MTTPSPALTPEISIDFTSAVLDPRITFTRAGATATRINSSGLLEVVAADTPRFDYNRATLACRGLLIEETRTNICTYSNAFNTGWGAFGTATTVANQAISPDGTNNAWSYTGSNGGNLKYKSFSANGTYTVSLWARGDVGGETLFLQSAPSGAYQAWTLTTSWQRFSFTYTGTWSRFDIGLGNTSQKAYIYEAQIEAGAFVTSNIPVAGGTAVVRNADVAVMTGANFSGWWQPNSSGIIVRARPGTVSGVRPWVQFDDGTANEIIALRGNTTNPELYIVDGGAPQAQIDAGTIAANTDYSFAAWWATNDCKARLDSGAVVTDTSATIPTVTQARLGSDGTNYLNGHLASISYYDSFSEQIYTRRKNKAVFNLM